MFNDLKQNESTAKVDDIFAESEKENSEPTKVPQPSLANLNLRKPDMPTPVSPLSGFDEGKDGSKSKKMLKTIFLIVIILAIILISAYFVYSKILLPKTLNVENNNTINTSTESTKLEELIVVNNEENINKENTTSEENISTSSEESGAMDALKTMDSDSDGLNDYDETYVYNTDPYLLDSDNDIISDYDEVIIFGTNPVLPDSDNDTYLDGKEIMSGYNPLGNGKINSLLFKDQNLFVEKYPELAGK